MTKIIWQQNSSNPNNIDNLTTISQWWENLNGKEISFAQRIIPPGGTIEEIDWQPQRLDENIIIHHPQIRGITVFWYKPDSEAERNITATKLELDNDKQQIYIYPLSQSHIVIRVTVKQIVYNTVELKNPQIAGTSIGENYVLLLRDQQQLLEIKIILNPTSLTQLLEKLQNRHNS